MNQPPGPSEGGPGHCCEIPGCMRPVHWSGRGRPGRYCGLVVDGVPHTRLTGYRLAHGQAVLPVPTHRPAGETPVTSAYSSLGQLRTELAALAGRIVPVPAPPLQADFEPIVPPAPWSMPPRQIGTPRAPPPAPPSRPPPPRSSVPRPPRQPPRLRSSPRIRRPSRPGLPSSGRPSRSRPPPQRPGMPTPPRRHRPDHRRTERRPSRGHHRRGPGHAAEGSGRGCPRQPRTPPTAHRQAAHDRGVTELRAAHTATVHTADRRPGPGTATTRPCSRTWRHRRRRAHLYAR